MYETIVDRSIDVLTGSYILMASWICCVIIGCIRREQPPSPPKELPYAKKYYMAFKQFLAETPNEELIKSLNEMYLKEDTDKGTVIMCYNLTTEAFHYWSDNDIPFVSLDAVAQLYSMVHHCKALCVDYKAEYNKAHSQQKDISLKPTKVLEGPFATFKSYKTKPKKHVVIPEKSNHFRKCGTIAVWNTQANKNTPGRWVATDHGDTGMVWNKHLTETLSNEKTLTYTDWVSRKDKKV